MNYEDHTLFFKALSDENRLKIIDMLSCGEICGCEILLELDITQSTLSLHMKILCDCALVIPRKEGKWTYYCQNEATVKLLKEFIEYITMKKEKCICNTEKDNENE